MIGESGYRPKSPEELRQQFETAQSDLGTKTEHMFTPPSADVDALLSMPLKEIKTKYKRRYDMYLQILRDQRSMEGLTPDEMEYFMKDDLEKFRKWLSALNSLDNYITEHHEGTDVTLRQRQITVFEDLRNFIEAGGDAGYVKIPTGVGKTVLFVELVESLNLKTLIVVPTKILIGQTEEKIDEYAEDLDVGKIYGDAKEYGRQVTIITYDSLKIQLEAGTIKPEDYDCLVLDEVHESLSDKRKETVQKFNKALMLGFTATPKYSDKKHVNEILPTEIHNMSIKEAVEGNMLCSFSSVLARTTVDLSKVSIDSKGEFTKAELEKAVNIKARNQAAVEMYKKAFDGERAVAYCVGVKHAEAVAKQFNENGVSAVMISGKTKNQEEILKKFKSGEIKVLCNADLLIAGFDEQQASVCLNLRPTLSKVVAEQRGGRVLRLNKNDLNKHASIIDFIDGKLPPERFPVLFAHVAGEAQITNPTIKDGREGGEGGGGRGRFVDIEIEGLEITTNAEEIMRVVNEQPKEYKEYKVEKLSLDELKKEVRTLKIDTVKKYREVLEDKPHWPFNPAEHYKGKGWCGYDNLFGKDGGKKLVQKISFEDFKAEVKAAGLDTFEKYRATSKDKPTWPAAPERFYKGKGWISFNDLFGKKEGTSSVEKVSLDKLKQELKFFGIDSLSKYHLACEDHPDWPRSPNEYYSTKGWKSFTDLLGKEKDKKLVPKISFADLKVEVRLSGIDSFDKYRAASKDKPTWPAAPERFYKGKGWVSWPDLFGK